MSDAPLPAQQAARPARVRSRHRLRTPGEARVWRRRMIGYALFAVSFVLMVNALVGENGYLATLRGHREIDSLMKSLTRLRGENQQLRDDVRRLREDPAALEEAARRQGLIHRGETLVVVKDRAPAAPRPQR